MRPILLDKHIRHFSYLFRLFAECSVLCSIILDCIQAGYNHRFDMNWKFYYFITTSCRLKDFAK